MTVTAVVYSEEYLKHDTGRFHPESPSRLTRAIEALRRAGLLDGDTVKLMEPRMASSDEMLRAHTRQYFDHVREACDRGLGQLDSDTPLSRDTFEIALLAAGGLLKGCEEILTGNVENTFALVRPPGHHSGVAGRALGAPSNGFCIFNNIAVAARSLIEVKGIRKVLILDLDCHHGNGTQEIFYGDSSVLFISLHQDGSTLYPGTGFPPEIGEGEGEGFNVNLPLPPGSGDDVYMKVYREVAVELAEIFNPDFVLVSAGFDSHKRDPVTYMNLTLSGYKELYGSVASLAERLSGGRLAVTLEGGYGDLFGESTVTAVASMARLECEVDELPTRSSTAINRKIDKLIEDVRGILKPYWRM